MKFATTIFLALGFLIHAQAAPLASDQFGYADGALNGANGGIGWSGGWYGATGGIVHPGLTYSDGAQSLDTTGGAFHLDSSGSGMFRDLSISVAQGSTLYVSFIGRVDAGDLAGLNIQPGGPLQLLVGKLPGLSTWGFQDFVGDVSTSSVPTSTQALL